MSPDPDEPIELYRARGLPEAHAVRAALEEAGVPARVDGDMLQGVVGEVPGGWVTAPRVLVGRARRERAEAVLVAFLEADRRSRLARADDRCLACSAPMGAADACPACGWSFAVGPSDSDGPVGESEERAADPPDARPRNQHGPRAAEPAGVESAMRVAQVVGGAVLLMLGLNSLPDLLGRFGHEDEFRLVGQAVLVGGEFVVGAVLLVLAIRGLRRPVRKTPGAEE